MATGINKTPSTYLETRYASSILYIHAEISAIINCIIKQHGGKINKHTLSKIRRKKFTVVSVRYKKINGVDCFGNARPCKKCVEWMRYFGIKNVIYTYETLSGELCAYRESLGCIESQYCGHWTDPKLI